MKSGGRISSKFVAARREGRAALIAYLTAGDPDIGATAAMARALSRAGVDVLELGVPFSDPISDGPTLACAAARALTSGTTLSDVFACAAEIQRSTDLALVLFSYANPLYSRGLRRSMREARAAGFDGVLLTDVPPEEAGEFLAPMKNEALDPIFLVSPTSTPERMRAAAAKSRGFLYVVSRAGTTGERKTLAADLPRTVARARRAAGELPIAVGFGISNAPSARQAAQFADGVVVGSALVAAAHGAGARRESVLFSFARSLRDACGRKT